MIGQPLVQNFRGNRALLWGGPDAATETLEKTLARVGVSLARFEDVDLTTLDPNRDVLLIDGDFPFNPASVLVGETALPIVPAIGIVGIEAPSRLRLLTEAGVTSFLRKPIHAGAVYSALFLCVNNYRRMRGMELRLAEHDRRRNGRRFVIKAVVTLVQSHGLNDDEAFAWLRRESMRRRQGIEESCEALLTEGFGNYPAHWPSDSTKAGSSNKEDYGDASLTNDDGCRDSDGRTVGRHGRGPDQARRA
ncbi:ANTAR domain-containing response regulator [Afipia birgiae]|jgi:AmiR/NasT family two-component response regulator|uniref:ANTAR domain-containing response regulator n=1 Tax=Afipia birgiae TaxID=151414 RepID=UPI000368D5D2|nr:ANTAR domain-containing protein [Afipia birgiae]